MSILNEAEISLENSILVFTFLAMSLIILTNILQFGVFDADSLGLSGSEHPPVAEKGFPGTETVKINGTRTVRLPPNISAYSDGFPWKIPAYKIETNSYGYRDAEFTKEPPENMTRVIITGDSNTFGWGVNRTERYSYQVEQNLKQECNVQVINTGIPGAGARDFSLQTSEFFVNYEPDILVVAYSPHRLLTYEERLQYFTKYPDHEKRQSALERLVKERRSEGKYKEYVFEPLQNIRSTGQKHGFETVFYSFSDNVRPDNPLPAYGPPEELLEDDEKIYISEYDRHLSEYAHGVTASRLTDILRKRLSCKTGNESGV